MPLFFNSLIVTSRLLASSQKQSKDRPYHQQPTSPEAICGSLIHEHAGKRDRDTADPTVGTARRFFGLSQQKRTNQPHVDAFIDGGFLPGRVSRSTFRADAPRRFFCFGAGGKRKRRLWNLIFHAKTCWSLGVRPSVCATAEEERWTWERRKLGRSMGCNRWRFAVISKRETWLRNSQADRGDRTTLSFYREDPQKLPYEWYYQSSLPCFCS